MGIIDKLKKLVKNDNKSEKPYPTVHKELLEVDKITTKLFPNLDEPVFAMDWIKAQQQQNPTHWTFKHISNPIEMNYRQQALSKSMTGQYDVVIQICNIGLEKFSNSPYLLYMLGRTFLDKREFTKATEIFDHTIILYPDFADCYVERGICKYNLGDTEGTKTDFSTARKIEPTIALPTFASNK